MVMLKVVYMVQRRLGYMEAGLFRHRSSLVTIVFKHILALRLRVLAYTGGEQRYNNLHAKPFVVPVAVMSPDHETSICMLHWPSIGLAARNTCSITFPRID